MDGRIAVIGSVNMDIGGYPSQRPVFGDSNPGHVHLSIGGVGSNIARNLAQLGAPISFLTALGGDMYAEKIEQTLSALGIDLSFSLRLPKENTSTYLFITDEHGDMISAICDMGIYKHQTLDYFERVLPDLNCCRAVVMDANLSKKAIEFLAKNLSVPVFADAVSAAKAPRLQNALAHLHTFKPNRIEAEVLTGIAIRNIPDAQEAAKRLLGTGLRRVFITLGSDGVFCAEEGTAFHMPAFSAQIRNATGAGDAFTAAIAWGWMHGHSLHGICQDGNAAAAIAAESEESVSPKLNALSLGARIKLEEQA